MTAPARAPADAGFRHEAVLYRGDRGFLDATVDFVRAGLDCGEPVVVAAIPHKLELLRAVLGTASADQVRFVDLAQVGRNPARIIPMWRDAVDAADGRRVRGVGEPVWAGRRGPELAEALLHEALLNVAFNGESNLLLRCPYDLAALGQRMATEAGCTHPLLVEGGAETHSAGYRTAGTAAGFGVPLPDSARWSPETFQFDGVVGVRRLRAMVGQWATHLGATADRAADLMLALHEVAVNSLLHGGGRGTLRLWHDGGCLVCEVADGGHIRQPLVGRVRPRPEQLSGRGVWLANQLCDLVQIRSSPAGTEVRLHLQL
jgi:anti-sigma regulatory factor (Ser/Thr protein kinase)